MIKNFKAHLNLNRYFLIFTLLIYANLLHATTIQVTNNAGDETDGSLNAAIVLAQNGDTIDCSPIAGQTISLSRALPAIGHGSESSTPTLTILGNNIVIDGGNSHPAFCLGQGSVTISDVTIQNGLSKGGNGGSGQTGGGGGTGGGGALYVHSGTTMTISSVDMNNNQAVGGNGGTANLVGGSGGGAGGFGGGNGGVGHVVSGSGGGGGGGGSNGGVTGGTCRGVGVPNTFTNYGGAGGGGGKPNIPNAGAGGSNAANPATSGGPGGQCSVSNAGGGGGGGGAGGAGRAGSNAIDATSPGTGFGGQGGNGFGIDNTYGAGGGGGGGSGGAGLGTSGGGGGFSGPGGAGGVFGGGGGASSSSPGGTHIGGNGGFGAGGGGGNVGGIDIYGLGGSGGSVTNAQAGGGGGSGFGGGVFVQKGGALIIQDGVSFSSNSTAAGTGGIATTGVNGGDGSSLGQDIFIQSGGSVTFQINNTLAMSTPIEGAGLLSEMTGSGLIKSGTGAISLIGENTYFGDTQIQSGIVNLNGSVIGNIIIEASGTLSGNATALGNIYNNGIISPGNSIGETFTTDLYLYPTSVYNVEVNSAGGSDAITASGLAQIDGNLNITPSDTNFTQPITYTIINTETEVTGQFSSITSSTPSLMSLVYNPSRTRAPLPSVSLTYAPLSAIGLTGNSLNTANAFVSLTGSDAATINSALLDLSFNEIQDAFSQMGPAQFSGITEVQLTDAILIRSIYSKHLQKSYFHKENGCGQPMNIWVDGFGQWQNQNNPFGFNDTTAGMTLGFDYTVRNWIVGGAFSTTFDTFDWVDFNGTANINSYYGGFYARWNRNDFCINFALIESYNRYKTTRTIQFGDIDRDAQSQHNGSELLAHIGFEYWASRSQFHWTPYANLDYVFMYEHAYTETGADSLNLYINQKNSALFQGEVGIALSTTCNTPKGTFIPMVTLAYINQTPCSNANYYATFANSSEIFVGTGGHYERNLFVPRFAFTYQDLCDKISISIYYDAQVGDNYWAQDVVLDLTFHF